MNPKKELLWGLWVLGFVGCNAGPPVGIRHGFGCTRSWGPGVWGLGILL